MKVKRVIDILLAGFCFIIFMPLFLFIAILIKIDTTGPVFFRQLRVGLYGELFHIYKFRTMVTGAEKLGAKVTAGNDFRITSVGRYLRKFKLDELPQLINVVIGDMSIVGPRPEVPEYVYPFMKEYAEILSIKPGITDYASLEYLDENELLKDIENAEEFYLQNILPAKIMLYRRYLREKSMKTDMFLIMRTIRSVVMSLVGNV